MCAVCCYVMPPISLSPSNSHGPEVLKCFHFCLKGLPFPGATPPWMVQDEDYSSGNQQIGPSYEEFLKESKLIQEW